MRTVKLTPELQKSILEDLLKRSPSQYGTYEATVNEILQKVREGGDQALFDYTEKFDKIRLNADTIRVTAEEIKEAYAALPQDFIEVLKEAAGNIRSGMMKRDDIVPFRHFRRT